MAVSLALNWNLPASTPLFDEGNPLGGAESQSSSRGTTTTSSPQTQTAASSAPSSATSQRSMASDLNKAASSSSVFPQSPHCASAINGAGSTNANANASHAGLKSYAAAASSPIPSLPQVPMPSYGGGGLGATASYGGFTSATPFSAGNSWSSNQPSAQSPSLRPHVSEDGRRIRSTSGPQRPSHLTYNDTLQHYPGPHMIAALQNNRPGLPPGAMQPGNLPHMASSPSLPASAGGYHPYRRATKTSDVTPSSSFSAQKGSMTQSHKNFQPAQTPQQPERVRSSSTSSSGTAREAASARNFAQTPTATYSSVASGALPPIRTPSDVNLSGHKHPYGNPRPTGPSRQSSMSSADPTGSTDSFATAGSDSYHHPEHSNSSQSSLSNTERQPVITPANTGRTTPIARKPLPSPLSRSRPVGVDSEDAFNSDDENTIGGRTTPTPGEKQKKGLSGKLRKALSLSTLQQVEAAAAAPDRAYGGRTNVATRRPDGSPFPHSSAETNGSSGSTRSTSPPQTPDNGAPLPGSSGASISSRRSTRPPISGSDGTSKRSIFNRKFNSSTDNISISSTVSSASMMLRKVGNLGKLARRSNIMGLTNMFNKDKEDGRAGVHTDDFGTLPTSSDLENGPNTTPAVAPVASPAKKSQKAKKGAPALASVSHATVELETSPSKINSDGNMTPAASYVRQHQLQMRAEAERVAKEKAEADRLAKIARSKTKTTDDVAEGRQKMIEKEKERLKSKRGWRKRLVGSLGSSSDAQQVTGLETVPVEETSVEQRNPNVPIGGGFNVPGGGGPVAQPQLGNAIHQFNETSFDSSFDNDEELEPPRLRGLNDGYESSDDFETDSLRHWGEGIERSRESAARIKNVKGILKFTASGSERTPNTEQHDAPGVIEKPFAGRLRANSYDAPQSSGQPTSSVPLMSQISTSASTDRVDGVPRLSEEERTPRLGDGSSRLGATTPTQSSSHGSNLGHHSNSSMPTLSLMMNPSPTGQRSMTAPLSRKRLIFADAHIYHSTWPAHVYDRRGELATCNRLTPLLAQRIKEELNTYKMEEMAVAPSSRIHTHFFV